MFKIEIDTRGKSFGTEPFQELSAIAQVLTQVIQELHPGFVGPLTLRAPDGTPCGEARFTASEAERGKHRPAPRGDRLGADGRPLHTA